MLPTTPSCIRQGALIYGSFNIWVYHWSRPKEVERCDNGVEGGKSLTTSVSRIPEDQEMRQGVGFHRVAATLGLTYVGL